MTAQHRSHARVMEVARFIHKEAARIAGKGDDPFAALKQTLARLEREEPIRQATIETAFADMAEARAELLASPLYADDPDVVAKKLSALSEALRHREKATQLSNGETA